MSAQSSKPQRWIWRCSARSGARRDMTGLRGTLVEQVPLKAEFVVHLHACRLATEETARSTTSSAQSMRGLLRGTESSRRVLQRRWNDSHTMGGGSMRRYDLPATALMKCTSREATQTHNCGPHVGMSLAFRQHSTRRSPAVLTYCQAFALSVPQQRNPDRGPRPPLPALDWASVTGGMSRFLTTRTRSPRTLPLIAPANSLASASPPTPRRQPAIRPVKGLSRSLSTLI